MDVRESEPLLGNHVSGQPSLRKRVYNILEQKTPFGVRLNYSIFLLIVVNVLAFIIGTDEHAASQYGDYFSALEAASVAIFTLEYILRLWAIVEDPHYDREWGRLLYVSSFFALVDLAAIAPFYLDLCLPETDLVSSQFVRVLRLFRLLKVCSEACTHALVPTVIQPGMCNPRNSCEQAEGRYVEAVTLFDDVFRLKRDLLITSGTVQHSLRLGISFWR
jgi:hypothetical protein